MNRRDLVPASADPETPMPAGAGACMDRVQAALATLREEERRLARLGLDEARARCRGQLRYWEFLAAVFDIAADPHARPDDPSGFRSAA
jgi:hypothetical protein